jgi:four helix bundle protein
MRDFCGCKLSRGVSRPVEADFISKMGIVEEETDESAFRIEMLVETNIIKENLVADLLDEAKQLTKIFVSSINTARRSAVEFRNQHSAIRIPNQCQAS